MIPVDVVRLEGEAEDEWQSPSAKFIRAVSKQIAAMRIELRMGIPVLTKDDLRRYRLYDAGAVLMELLGSGDDWAAQTMWQLLRLDGEARRELDAVSARALRRPPLANCPELLHALAEGLAASARATNSGDRAAAGECILQLALLAWARGLAWWWLTERMLELAAESCQDGGLSEASTALTHGTFLLYKLREYGESLAKLTLAAQLASGQPWTASTTLLQLLPEEFHSLQPDSDMFQVASRALGEALLLEARVSRSEDDFDRAAALCMEAVQRVRDARCEVLELRAERELGESLLEGGKPEEATATFRRFLELARNADSPRDVVTAHLKLALSLSGGEGAADAGEGGTLECLRNAREAAEKLNQPDLLARTHACLGEYFLNTTRPHYATTHFHQACRLYHDEGLGDNNRNRAEGDRVRALAGIAGGLELWSSMVQAIEQCGPGPGPGQSPQTERPEDRRGHEHLDRLVAWKDHRAPFWPDHVLTSQAVRSMTVAFVPEPTTPSTPSSRTEVVAEEAPKQQSEVALDI